MAGLGNTLGQDGWGVPIAHQLLLHLLLSFKTMATQEVAVVVERAPKNTLKLPLESTAPLAPMWPQKQPLAPRELLQCSQLLLLGNGTGRRDGPAACVSR